VKLSFIQPSDEDGATIPAAAGLLVIRVANARNRMESFCIGGRVTKINGVLYVEILSILSRRLLLLLLLLLLTV
jgi:hypothetical protein